MQTRIANSADPYQSDQVIRVRTACLHLSVQLLKHTCIKVLLWYNAPRYCRQGLQTEQTIISLIRVCAVCPQLSVQLLTVHASKFYYVIRDGPFEFLGGGLGYFGLFFFFCRKTRIFFFDRLKDRIFFSGQSESRFFCFDNHMKHHQSLICAFQTSVSLI